MKTKNLIVASIVLALFGFNALSAGSTVPVLTDGEMPEYSEFARSHDLKGTVVLEALVDENGHVFAAEVVDSVHAELDKAALAAVADWKFNPAMEDGKAVMKVVRIPINFNLIDPVEDSLLRAHDQAIARK